MDYLVLFLDEIAYGFAKVKNFLGMDKKQD